MKKMLLAIVLCFILTGCNSQEHVEMEVLNNEQEIIEKSDMVEDSMTEEEKKNIATLQAKVNAHEITNIYSDSTWKSFNETGNREIHRAFVQAQQKYNELYKTITYNEEKEYYDKAFNDLEETYKKDCEVAAEISSYKQQELSNTLKVSDLIVEGNGDIIYSSFKVTNETENTYTYLEYYLEQLDDYDNVVSRTMCNWLGSLSTYDECYISSSSMKCGASKYRVVFSNAY